MGFFEFHSLSSVGSVDDVNFRASLVVAYVQLGLCCSSCVIASVGVCFICMGIHDGGCAGGREERVR